MAQLFLVGIGGFAGAISRYLLSALVQDKGMYNDFPLGTLAVNLVGCLIIGLLNGVVEHQGWFGRELQMLVLVGFVGSFTTFSTFGADTLKLMEQGNALKAILYIGLQILPGLLLVWSGLALSRFALKNF